MNGKTIARIEMQPTDPEYGYARDDTVLIHFTDGTALKIAGSSYEEVSQDVESLTREEIAAWTRAAMGRREQERLSTLRRQEWLAISCEERAERRAKEQADRGPFAMLMNSVYQESLAELLRDSNRMLYGQEARVVKHPCVKCGDYDCPNAKSHTEPARPAPSKISFEIGSAFPDQSDR